MANENGLTYKDAGVDIDAGNRLVDRIKPLVAATRRPEVLQGIGGFGGLFGLPEDRYQQPVLVAGTDGVGTKLKLAQELGRHGTIGIDLVAMCVNDVVVQGAEPLFFLDYFATGQLDTQVAEQVIAGIANGCTQAGCALIGGETAEMPDMYQAGEYDLAGFNVGAVERSKLIDGSEIRPGDVIIGMQSSGPHSNGYSLIRKIVDGDPSQLEQACGDKTLADALMEPTIIYVKPILSLLREVGAHGLAHITGGGITENIIRVVPDGLAIEIQLGSWSIPEVFSWLQTAGNVAEQEMLRTFNCGLGFCVIVPEEKADEAIAMAADYKLSAWPIGKITHHEGDQRVVYRSS